MCAGCDPKISNWFFKHVKPGYPDWMDMRPNYAHIEQGHKWEEGGDEKTYKIKLLDYGVPCGDENVTTWWHWLFLTNRTILDDDLSICDPKSVWLILN